jgi:hypothetical protein
MDTNGGAGMQGAVRIAVNCQFLNAGTDQRALTLGNPVGPGDVPRVIHLAVSAATLKLDGTDSY